MVKSCRLIDHATLPILLLFDGVDTVVLNAGDVLTLIFFAIAARHSEQHQYRLCNRKAVRLSV